MRQSIITILILISSMIQEVTAQRLTLPESPDSLGSIIKEAFYHIRSESARTLGDEVERMWYDGSIPLDEQRKILSQLDTAKQKGLKLNPDFRAYFTAIVNAKTIESLDAQKFSQYLNVTRKVIENYDKKAIHKYLTTCANFFEHRAIHYDKPYQLFISDDSYRFDYVATMPEVIEEPDPDESEQSDDNQEDGDWDEDEEWSEDDNWDEEEISEEEQTDENSAIDVLTTEEAPPQIQGPVIRFDKVTLNMVTAYDSVFIQNTKGDFSIVERMFVGNGGKFDWQEMIVDSVASPPISAEFFSYHFKTYKPQIEANKVLLTYPERLYEAIEGTFLFKSVKHDSTKVYFPHFTSYSPNINLKGLGNDNIKYSGGFSLKGYKISSASVLSDKAKIEYANEKGRKFKSIAPLFEFGDSTIVSRRSAVTLYNGVDSLYHPYARFKFGTTDEKLVVQKEKGSKRNTPFYESYFNMNIQADIIRWNVNRDTLEISQMGARKEVAAVFESVQHFDSLDFNHMSGIFNFSPLMLTASYSRKSGKQFYVDDVAKRYKIKENVLKSAMDHLNQKGFVKYNSSTGEINVKKKLFHYVNSYKAKKDFDDIIIESKIDTAANAVYALSEKKMLLRGVKELYVSDPLNVRIEPDTSEMVLTGDRDFIFDGKIIAGNFEYIGRDYKFDYDSFLVHLGHVDSIKLYIKEKTKDGRTTKKAIDNTLKPGDGGVKADIDGDSGTLYINRPDNKSGRDKLPNYPRFNAGMGAKVSFGRDEILDGVYGESVSFETPPFTIDSLNDSDPGSIKFGGKFNSGGIFPPFEEKLHVMEDYSLGFDHEVPSGGYELYQDKGLYHGEIKLDKQGITGKGNVDFLATSFSSEDFVFYPDSVIAKGPLLEIKEEEHNGVKFPQMTLNNYDMHWKSKKDSMNVYNTDEAFDLYKKTATLDGMATITSKGVYGKGKLETRGAEMSSEEYKFGQKQIAARHADFKLNSDDPEKPALMGDDVRLKFNLEENYANISPEVEGEAALRFPYAQMNTSITNARWDLNEQKVIMEKPKDAPLESSYFYTVNEDLDSLSFYATAAEYDINSLEMKVSGIPYIIVADAKITPEGGEVLIHENSRIGQLTNTTIVLDTLNGYHRLYDGVIDIKSRNEFSGHATYQYVNSLSDTFAIKMENFRLEQFADSTASGGKLFGKKKGQKMVLHSVANGSVIEEDKLLVSPMFFFKGDMTLQANKPALSLDGYVRIDSKHPEHFESWIKYTSDGSQKAVVIPYNESITQGGKRIKAGLHFSALDNSLYGNIFEDKHDESDDDFFNPSGSMYFDEKTKELMIADLEKTSGESLEGSLFGYNDDNDEIRFEGKLHFINSKKGASILASGSGRGNLHTNQYSINSLMSMDFAVPSQAYQIMASDLLETIETVGAPDGLGDPTDLLYKLANLSGDRVAKEYEKASATEYVSLGGMSKEVAKPMVFANIDFKWSDANRAFYSEGKLGMSNIQSSDINAGLDGFFEIKKDEAGGTIVNMFVKASADSWYFFGYEADRLMLFSSNNAFNSFISSKSNSSKAKAGELVFYPGSKSEVLDFINRFRKDYYGIDDYYDLGSEVEEEVGEGTDGFGGEKKDESKGDKPAEEEDEDDGF